ncbi:hypothetical protein ACWGH8_06165 [Nonomuraea muscovyensis]
MNTDIDQLKTMLQAYDPAGNVHVDHAGMDETLHDILRTPPAPARRRRPRWRLLVPAAAMLAGAGLATSVVLQPQEVGPVRVGPAAAEALTFSKKGGAIEVRIVDPNADPARYRAEFAAQGLDVELKMAASSPSLVGKMIDVSSPGGIQVMDINTMSTKVEIERDGRTIPIELIKDDGGCGNTWCGAGARIPKDLHIPLHFTFGRPPRPGERYEFKGEPTAQGEVLQGLTVKNRTVAEVRKLLRERGATLGHYFTIPPGPLDDNPDESAQKPIDTAPDGWYVHQAFLEDAPKTIDLLVAPWRATS